MSAIPADSFVADAYNAPSAELLNTQHAIKDRWFSTAGRLGVLSFHARSLVCMIVSILSFLPVLYLALDGLYGKSNELHTILAGILFLLIVIPTGVFFIITSVKRHHDLGLSGWLVPLSVVPAVGFLWMIYYSFAKGKTEANSYGVTKPTSTVEKFAGITGFGLLILLALGQFFLFFGSFPFYL